MAKSLVPRFPTPDPHPIPHRPLHVSHVIPPVRLAAPLKGATGVRLHSFWKGKHRLEGAFAAHYANING